LHFIDVLYVSKSKSDNGYRLNMVRVANKKPEIQMFNVHGLQFDEPVRRLEVLRSFDVVQMRPGYQRKAEEEYFVLQFEGENKAFALPLCGPDQYLSKGRECLLCAKSHFNLDPQGTSCEHCSELSVDNNAARDYIHDAICFGWEYHYDDGKVPSSDTGTIFDF